MKLKQLIKLWDTSRTPFHCCLYQDDQSLWPPLKAKWSIAIDQQNVCCSSANPQSTWPAPFLALPLFFTRDFPFFKWYRDSFRVDHTGVVDAHSGCLSLVYWQREIYQRPTIWIGVTKVILSALFGWWMKKEGRNGLGLGVSKSKYKRA